MVLKKTLAVVTVFILFSTDNSVRDSRFDKYSSSISLCNWGLAKCKFILVLISSNVANSSWFRA